MDTRLILKVGLLYRIHEGWLSVGPIGDRLGAMDGQVVRARDWLLGQGYLEAGAFADAPCRWLPQREFEELWNQLVPDRPCSLSFCKTVTPRGGVLRR